MTAFIQNLPPIVRGRLNPLIKEARDRYRRRRRWMLATCIVLALVATAFAFARPSSQTVRSACAPAQCTGHAAAAIPNACGLLTNHEVARLLRHPIQFRAAESVPSDLPYRSCSWTAVPFNNRTYNGNRLTLSIIAIGRTHFAQAASAIDAIRIRGLGSMAYKTTGPAYLLGVYYHGYSVTLSGTSPDQLPGEERLARQIIARLP